jgi:hypothetical protein
VQLRRIVLLFALVLGLVAVVTSLAPPPSERESDPAPPVEAPEPEAQGAAAKRSIRLMAPARGRPRLSPVATGTRLTVVVSVEEPGDVEIEGLGLRQTADPRAPARFDLLAAPAGRYRVSFHTLGGRTLPVARLVFEERASLRLREGADPGAA